MGFRIRTNIESLIARRHLESSTNSVAKHMNRLSSGLRINRSADDSAGQAIAENLNAQIRSLHQAQRNTSDGISMIQVAEGGLTEINNIIVRLRELAIQGASDTIGNRERMFLQDELDQMRDEVDRIAQTTEFNGIKLLTGGQAPEGKQHLQPLGPIEVQVDTHFYAPIDNKYVKNPVNIIRLNFDKMNALASGEGSLGLKTEKEEVQISSKAGSQNSLQIIDQALDRVNGYRARLGALQNRLTSTKNNLSVRIENLSDAKSRILDADFAQETAQLTQNTILQQAGASVLAQANQIPKVALSLLAPS
jgi:flagellin